MSSTLHRRLIRDARRAIRPSPAHLLPFLVVGYVVAYAGGVWASERAVPDAVPADPTLLVIATSPVIAYVAAIVAVVAVGEHLPEPHGPTLVGLAAFAAVTAASFGAVWNTGIGLAPAPDTLVIAVLFACCWPAVAAAWLGVTLLWSGSLPEPAFFLLLAIGAAATAFWQYWLVARLVGWTPGLRLGGRRSRQ